MRSPWIAGVAVLMVAVGCGTTKPDPRLSAEQFPRALASLESNTESILRAFRRGDPAAADRPMHLLGKIFGTINRLAEPAGLTGEQQTQLKAATESMLDAFAELHEPLHAEVFPEDFDPEPFAQRLEQGMKDIRSALPTGMVATLQAASEKRAADRAAMKANSPPLVETEDAAAAADASADPSDAGPIDTDPSDADPALEAADPAPDPAPDAGAGAATPAGRNATESVAWGGVGEAVAPLCPTVMLFDANSYGLAPERVNRAAELLTGAPPGRRWVQLVPTLHARLAPDLSIEAYGLMTDRAESWTTAENFTPATDALADRFRDAFAAAIRQAVRRGLCVSVLPHLDSAGGPVNEWRNFYRFSPGETIGAGSYESLLIEPLAAAIDAEATSDTRIDFALSGEMGRSLFTHPDEYARLLQRLRQRFAANPSTAGVRVGVSLNWSDIAGPLAPESVDRVAIGDLISDGDFVGVSCYAPVSVPPTADDFRQTIERFVDQLVAHGADRSRMPPIVVSEVGIGGGPPRRSLSDFPSAESVAAQPYEANGQLSAAASNWRHEPLAKLRHGFHEALCSYLSEAARREPPVERAFLWSEGPWDPQGVADRRFRDEKIAAMIAEHNAR